VSESSAPPCLACGGKLVTVLTQVTDTRFGVVGEWDIARCETCGLEQTLPRPEPAELGRLYAAHYNFGGERNTLYTRLRGAFLTSPLYRVWLAIDGDISFHVQPGQGRLIDVGCNEGRGLSLYARNGFTAVEGLETNPTASAAARGRGFTVHEQELSEFQPSERYDVVVLSNVLEHALIPAEMLADVRRILKPGGEVWISCPNADSKFRHLFGRAWINWHVPFHITHFTETTLAKTVTGAGFEVIAQTQITPALWVAHSLLAWAGARPGKETRLLRNPFTIMAVMALTRGLLFALLFMANRAHVGDCLILRARRTGP
jgi:2-polyprenyl-3-methyl-5-hydroxy-6-metoxy-1,4-benzoquinol methylase